MSAPTPPDTTVQELTAQLASGAQIDQSEKPEAESNESSPQPQATPAEVPQQTGRQRKIFRKDF